MFANRSDHLTTFSNLRSPNNFENFCTVSGWEHIPKRNSFGTVRDICFNFFLPQLLFCVDHFSAAKMPVEGAFLSLMAFKNGTQNLLTISQNNFMPQRNLVKDALFKY